MTTLKDVVNKKLFGGKLKFRSDVKNEDVVEEAPTETTEEQEEE